MTDIVATKPSSDPDDYTESGTGYALGDFHVAWVPEMEKLHHTFTSDFVRDSSYPGIVRTALVLCPFVQTALSGRWHILDQNDDAAHNDRAFRLQRRLALLLQAHRRLDPLACDVLVAMLEVHERKAGRHALVSRDYEPFDDLASLHRWRVYRFADRVLRHLGQDEDLASYDVGDGFAWPEERRGPGPVERPVAAIPQTAKDRPTFDEAAIRAMVDALEADGRGVKAIAEAVRASLRDLSRAHDHVLFEGCRGGAESGAAGRDEFVARRHASYAGSPEGIVGLPDGFSFGVVLVDNGVLDRLREKDRDELLRAEIGLLDWMAQEGPGVTLKAAGSSLARCNLTILVGPADSPLWKGSARDVASLLMIGMAVVVADNDPGEVQALVDELGPVLREFELPAVMDLRGTDPAGAVH